MWEIHCKGVVIKELSKNYAPGVLVRESKTEVQTATICSMGKTINSNLLGQTRYLFIVTKARY